MVEEHSSWFDHSHRQWCWGLIIAREKRHGACFQSVILKPITSHECCTPFSSNSLPACWLTLGIPSVFSLICNGSIAFPNTERQTGAPYEYDTSSDHPSRVSRYLVLVWDGNPTLRQLRRVLTLVYLQEVRHVMEELCHADACQPLDALHYLAFVMWRRSHIHLFPPLAGHPCFGSSDLKYFSRASANTSARRGASRLTLTSWTCAGVIWRAIPLPF